MDDLISSQRVMLKVPNGQDPYTVIGQYIRNHITAIEDIIATIELDGIRTNELFMVDMQEDGYFVWKSDWYEGEENVALIDFFPVSSAEPERKTGYWHITDAYPHNVYCSECHKKYAQTHWAVWEDGSLPRSFCPNCGAKMEGQKNENGGQKEEE